MNKRVHVKDLHHRHFQGLVGRRFKIGVGKKSARATLLDVTHLGPKPSAGASREPFSLVFRLDPGVADTAGVYRLEHSKLGRHELLMTPLVPDGEGSYFEVVFS